MSHNVIQLVLKFWISDFIHAYLYQDRKKLEYIIRFKITEYCQAAWNFQLNEVSEIILLQKVAKVSKIQIFNCLFRIIKALRNVKIL